MSIQRSSARIKAKNEAATVRTTSILSAKFTAIAVKSAENSQPKKRRRMLSPKKTEMKSKETSVKIRGVRGKLKLMTEMPLDILFETFSHLELADLLSLTKASKALSDILFSPSAISIWKSAYLNIEANPRPPDVPSGMNMVQYAKFLYGHNCSYCPSHNANFAHWAERIRLCKECLEKSIFRPKNYDPTEWTARTIVPVWIVRRPEYDRWYYLKTDFQQTVNKLRDLHNDAGALEKYIAEKKEETEERNKFASGCRFWESGLKSQRKRQLEEIRLKRRTDIAKKLEDLGWEDEVQRLGNRLSTLPGVDQPKPLTPRIWDNIRDDIIETLEEVKEDRLKRERLQMLRRRVGTLRSALMELPQTTDIVPDFADICAVQPFRTIIFKTPREDSLTKEQFAASLTEFSNIAAEWRTSCVQQLFELLPRPFDVSALKLATVFFRCHWCTEPITYPRILKHACLVKRYSDLDDDDDELQQACSPVLPWNLGGEQISFDDEASSFARDIIKSCGQDPERVTMSEMDVLDPRVECLCCAHPSRGRLVMKWKIAVSVVKSQVGIPRYLQV
ncbi:hypothetical protein BDZ94DRAFT_374652 [Collybia nuda]|uniref:F-box domain-containing protein n=1 Tax=Collybia nuda TaxID=64659 RepID=A0A9P5YIM3_9AGAR|nr:hypothetical protein BDZ94DRAFT_374652 [Collybia nuda]